MANRERTMQKRLSMSAAIDYMSIPEKNPHVNALFFACLAKSYFKSASADKKLNKGRLVKR